MSQEDVIKAWKDEDYRSGLSEEARAALPAHPAGLLELTDEALDDLIANGGAGAGANRNSCWFLSCNNRRTVSDAASTLTNAASTPTNN